VAVQAGTNKVAGGGGRSQGACSRRTPANIVAVRPLKDGVIGGFRSDRGDAPAFHYQSARPADAGTGRVVVIAVPSGISRGGKRAVRESATHAGAP